MKIKINLKIVIRILSLSKKYFYVWVCLGFYSKKLDQNKTKLHWLVLVLQNGCFNFWKLPLSSD